MVRLSVEGKQCVERAVVEVGRELVLLGKPLVETRQPANVLLQLADELEGKADLLRRLAGELMGVALV